MTQIEALQQLEALGTQGFETRDAAALLRVTATNANKILGRLKSSGFLVHVARGRWVLSRNVNRQALPELIAAPYPAYLSLQSALFHHGLIEQIPSVIYAVTLGRPRRVDTSVGTVSFHRIPPELFTGFELVGKDHVKIATAEKALFDTLYLAPGKTRLFARLPELEIPKGFKWGEVERYVRLVKSEIWRRFLRERARELKEG